MKKAFTLLELTISCVIFASLLVLVSKSLKESYRLNFKALENAQVLLELNSALLQTQNLLSKCLQIQSSQGYVSCFLRDDENILDLNDKNEAYLLNSTLILENNTSLYAPKSHFLELLQRRKILFKDEEKRLFVWTKDGLKTLQILSDERVNADFSGVFLPLKARLDLRLKDSKLLYDLKPKFQNDALKQSGVLAQDISIFELQKRSGVFFLKLCMQKENANHCLQKRLNP